MGADERDMIRTQVQPQLIKEFRRDKDPIAKWALAVSEKAQKPLVPGKPPLTRQVTDAYAELVAFLIDQSVPGAPFEVDGPFRDSVAKQLTSEWRRLKAPDRAELLKVPALWAAVRSTWPSVPSVRLK